jgi:transcription antitermination factor NusG
MQEKKQKPEKKWYALYTRSRWEKKIHEALVNKGIESYLPMQKTLRQWSDRKKWVDEPLLRSYVFVRIYQKDYQESLKTTGVVTFVKTAGKMSPVQDEEIRILKIISGSGEEVQITTEHFKRGDPVEVVSGRMRGLYGTLVQHRGKYQVMVRIEAIDQNLMINIPVVHLKKIKKLSG